MFQKLFSEYFGVTFTALLVLAELLLLGLYKRPLLRRRKN